MKKEIKYFFIGFITALLLSTILLILNYKGFIVFESKSSHVPNSKASDIRGLKKQNQIVPLKNINEDDKYEFQVYVSPDNSHLIVVYYVSSEGCSSPVKAILYTLPLDDPKKKEIIASEHYSWSNDGKEFVTNEGGKMVICDLNGNSYILPGYGDTPTFNWDKIYYYCELSDKGESVAPTIMSYDVNTREKRVIYTFDKEYTFWPEQIDSVVIPEMTFTDSGSIGIKGYLYPKEDYSLGYYEFLVSFSGELLEFRKH